MKEVTESEFQRECEAFVNRNTFICQSALVDNLFQREIFSWDDVVNSIEEFESQGLGECYECKQEANVNSDDICETCFDPQDKEIFEWWVIDNNLKIELEKRNEPILDNDFGTWWGRTGSGQAISMDQVIRDIVSDIYEIKIKGE